MPTVTSGWIACSIRKRYGMIAWRAVRVGDHQVVLAVRRAGEIQHRDDLGAVDHLAR